MHFSVVASLLLLVTFVSATYQPDAATLAANDIHVLQYALILENLEYTFYNTYQNRFTAQDFVNAGLTATDYTYFNLIRDHELAHVQYLNSSVPSATSSCTYNFNVNSVSDYIQLAMVLENTGVSAYDGAINNFYNPAFAQAAATIATIEARHASYLNRINNQNPFPGSTYNGAFDDAKNSSVIANAIFNGASPLATCTFVPGFQLPQLYYVYPVQNASDASQPTAATLTANDVTVLQYALFLEHLEAAFYQYVNQTFTQSQYPSIAAYNYFNLIGQHEATHVAALSSVISQYGITPIADCTYNFSAVIQGNITTAIAYAAALENTGVSAYDGAVNAINDPTLKEIAATIATVEARHASYINYLNLGSNNQGPVQGSNGPFDFAYNFTTVYGIVISTNLIASCPALPSPYSVFIVKPYTNSTFTPSTSGSTGTVAPTPAPVTTGTTGTVAPTPAPATTGTAATTGVATTGASTTGSVTGATTRASTTSRTSGASIASASVVVAALLVAAAAF